MSENKPCESGGISITMFLLVSALVLIVLSSIDFHTGLIWAASPRVDAEVRYIVTLLSISLLFAYMYCQHIQLRAIVHMRGGKD
jgi:hypothetical protein